jgi:tRNA (guanosine-2'-O-)-methyltransferase
MVKMPTKGRLEKLQKVLQNRQSDLTIVCENIHDPHNVSAVLRSCDAVGVSQVYLLYTKERFPELGKKSSASASKWIDLIRYKNYDKVREALKKKRMNIYATYIDPSAKSIYDIDWTLPSAIMVGNEHRGVSKECLNIADDLIYIPMLGMVESLNVSVATAVILYEACRQRILHNNYPTKNTQMWLEEKLQQWIQRKKNF